ncbi:MAG: pilus assembly protein CpaF [Actinomycetota bacterium]|nr:pilus assembly protein CpaF [Actinomycetota bacterium]
MVIPLVLVVAGICLMVGFAVAQGRRERDAIDEVLGRLPLGPTVAEAGADGASGDGAESPELEGLAGRATDLAEGVLRRFDPRQSLGPALERARIPMHAGEFLIVTAAAGLGLAAVLLALTGSVPLALVGPVAAGMLSYKVVHRRIVKRRKAFENQLPDALSLVASSLSAGHTFLRAIQMMCEEAGPPLSEEFALVVAETRLGDPVVASLERMAARLQVRDMDMVVQAIRIQQTVGGRLATLLHTLSDFIRMRAELRREVSILTAEGRMSAYVLAGLVPFLLLMMQVLNPTYVRPLYSGSGLFLLIGCGLSVVAGMFTILRMVKIDV